MFVCKKCARIFDRQWNLDQHYQSKHSADAIAKVLAKTSRRTCADCGHQFCRRYDYLQHRGSTNVCPKLQKQIKNEQAEKISIEAYTNYYKWCDEERLKDGKGPKKRIGWFGWYQKSLGPRSDRKSVV